MWETESQTAGKEYHARRQRNMYWRVLGKHLILILADKDPHPALAKHCVLSGWDSLC